MFRRAAFPLLAILMTTSACSTLDDMGNKQALGTLGGAAAGGFAGSQFGSGKGKLVTTGLGVLLGAVFGGEIGSSLDKADQLALQDTTTAALNAPKIGKAIVSGRIPTPAGTWSETPA